MKRLTALALTLLLLLSAGLSARADEAAYHFALSFSLDEEEAAELTSKAGFEDSRMLARGFAELFSNLKLEFSTRSDGTAAAAQTRIDLKTRTLLSYAMQRTGEDSFVQSSLFPGCRLMMPVPEPEEVSLPQTDLAEEYAHAAEKARSEMKPLLDFWAGTLDTTEEQGIFTGDAYAGGTLRRTWQFDDRDFAALVDALLDAETDPLGDLIAVLETVLNALEADSGERTDLREAVRHTVREYAWTNENSYRWSEVCRTAPDGAEQPVGASGTIYRGTEPIATLSVGRDGPSARFVLGFGQKDANWYIGLTADVGGDEQGGELNGLSLDIVRDEAGIGYALSAREPANHLIEADLRLVRDAGTVRFATTVRIPAFDLGPYGLPVCSHAEALIRGEGVYDTAEKTLTASQELYLDGSDKPCFHVRLTGDTDVQISTAENLPAIDLRNGMDQEESSQLSDALQLGTQQLLANLMMTVPPDLMGYFSQFFLP